MEKRSKNATGIIVHCSVSDHGDVDLIRKWHTDKPPDGNGWSGVGYNYVITNGCRMAHRYKKEDDGLLELGRSIDYVGAHARGYNEAFLSICMIGTHFFTAKQFQTLFETVDHLRGTNKIDYFVDYTPITKDNFKGHYEVDDKGKTCPNMDMDFIRQQLNLYLADPNRGAKEPIILGDE